MEFNARFSRFWIYDGQGLELFSIDSAMSLKFDWVKYPPLKSVVDQKRS